MYPPHASTAPRRNAGVRKSATRTEVSRSLADRFLLYATRDYSSQLQRGDNYADLTPTVSVLWVDARLFPAERRFHLRFELQETSSGARYNDHLTLHVMQLPEISKASAAPTEAERALHNWGRFFGATEDEQFAALAREDATMAAAIEALEHLSQDPEAQRLAREREESVWLYKMSLAHSRREGIAEGRVAALQATIRKLSAMCGIEPTSAQLALLEDPKVDLDQILESLMSDRRWP
jgi:predicted transposase/invertase (TIGR01784 family)